MEFIPYSVGFDGVPLLPPLVLVERITPKPDGIADLLEDRLLAFRTAERGGRALVRSDTGWRFISILAERLIDRGVVRGTSVFGRAPVSTADWFCHWPPTLEQLRTGWLPCH